VLLGLAFWLAVAGLGLAPALAFGGHDVSAGELPVSRGIVSDVPLSYSIRGST
jgi:hypothetical protein